ncbi:MAG TPA: N-acyl homoserine lactonase family protein [Gemmatimonadales bacterium]|nr:N-acyl homoserine lactonase family protein [Gemmatimonadales bacterium]
MKMFGVTTGTLQLKPTFLDGSPAHGGPLGLMLALRRDHAFTRPLPMWAWVIETAKERILIDAGGRSGMQGAVTGTRFEIKAEQDLVPVLAQHGIRPADIDRVLMTHLHGDHVGGLAAFDPRRVWVARPEWAPVVRFPGRLMRPLVAPVEPGFAPQLFDFDGPPMLGFPGSWPVTSDGSITALPTPGHSPGHTSYLVRTREGDVLLAGDVTYDLPALEAARDQGILADVERHHETLERVRALVRSGVAYLPSHDPDSPRRLPQSSRAASDENRDALVPAR